MEADINTFQFSLKMSAGRYPLTHHDRSDDSIAFSESFLMQNKQELQQSQHKRVYQACIPCRRRKVKCDLGSVDNPNDPPCVRCRRECKECYFSAIRRKRKVAEEGRKKSSNQYNDNGDYDLHNKRRATNTPNSPLYLDQNGSIGDSQSVTSIKSIIHASFIPGPPLTPGGSIGCSHPLSRPNQNRAALQSSCRTQDSSTQLENLEAQEVMRQKVYGPYDALDLLYKAATDSTSTKGDKIDHKLPRNLRSSLSSHHIPSPMEACVDDHIRKNLGDPLESRMVETKKTHTSSNLSSENIPETDQSKSPGYDEAIKAWARFRFVRAGWFTAAEAIEYIEYYYEYMSPLTPISPPTFRDPATHFTLLTEEPFLAVTLLSIATRYRRIPDSGGNCRSYAIHEQLWTYLRGMIERCLWGQEAFVGRLYGSIMNADSLASGMSSGRGLRRGSLRTLGTIESLMILTEWHPRALHFPPIDVTDDLMIPSYDCPDSYCTDEDANSRLPRATGSVGGKRIVSWLEPAWRSDRMCWMLMSTAMGLSNELGIFENIENISGKIGDISIPEYEEAYRLRATRIKRLLVIYATQLAGRLGWTSMVPDSLCSTDPSFAPWKQENLRGAEIAGGKVSSKFNYIPDLELDDQIIHCWAGITNVMRLANETLFKSRQYTTKIIQDGSYVEILQGFQPMLRDWKVEFEIFRLPSYIRHILTIEYEYTRIYINSLSLQAVVERCSCHAGPHPGAPGESGNDIPIFASSPAIRDYYGKLPLARLGGISAADEDYIREVVDGSRNLLKTVVEGLLPNEYLKHVPVRTYFRIVSGAMFLLKTFALGASKNDVEISIGLMDRAVDALRNCIVDDVHLVIRFADLLEALTSRLRCRFIIAPANPAHIDIFGRHCCSAQSWPEEKCREADNETNCEWGITSYVSPSASNTRNDANFLGMPVGQKPSRISPNTSSTQPSHDDVCNSFISSEKNQDVLPETSDWGSGNEVWYLPPGMAFFQNINDQAVAQTSEGVNVGGMDLLDFMALDPLEPFDDFSSF